MASQRAMTPEALKSPPRFESSSRKGRWDARQSSRPLPPIAADSAKDIAQQFPGSQLGTSKASRTRRSPSKRASSPSKSLSSSGSGSALEQTAKTRDSFREALVHLINTQDESFKASGVTLGKDANEELAPAPGQSASIDERDVLRYYYYIQNGIDTEHIEAMDDSWVKNIMAFVDNKLKVDREATIENLWDEVRDDYLTSIKKAIVDFVLKDDRQEPAQAEGGDEQLGAKKPAKEIEPYTADLQVVPKPWTAEFQSSRVRMRDNLHLNHPMTQYILNLWHADFHHLRIIDTKLVSERKDGYELSSYVTMMDKHMETCLQTLKQKWIARAVNEINARKRYLPKQLEGYFNCVATVMSSQVRGLLLESLRDYQKLFEDDLGGENSRGVNFSGFEVRLLAKDKDVAFEPSIDSITTSLLKVVDAMQACVSELPRCETLLDGMPRGADEFLVPVVADSHLAPVRAQIESVMKLQLKFPESIAADYREKYMALIDRSADKEVTDFLADEHTFVEYIEKINEFKAVSEEISFERPKGMRKGMFEVSLVRVNKELARRAKNLADKLILRVKDDATRDTTELSTKFKAIADRALEIPQNTDHLVELKTYIAKARTKEVPKLTKQVDEARKRMEFMITNSTLSGPEMEANMDLFTWLKRLDPVFDKHVEIIETARLKAENALKQKRVEFVDEMKELESRVLECKEWGDVEATPEYLKNTQAMSKQLEEAQNTIEDINHQEEAFNWDMSLYPQKQKLTSKLEPFLKLYSSVEDFKSNKKLWLHGDFGEVNPEKVEDFSMGCWRGLYKLEKDIDSPVARQIAATVKEDVDEFKKHLPLIVSLCNPGMRDRHWDAMSEAVGFQLKPDEDTTLSKFLDMDLETHKEQFEIISEGATKEYKLEKMLEKMKLEWDGIEFAISEHDGSKTYKFGGMDELQMLLDDHIVKAQTMLGSPHIKPFESETQEWSDTLNELQDIIDNSLKVQSTWMYLYPIFSSPDIMAQMPEEGRRFTQVDKSWRDIMGQAQLDHNVMTVIKIDKMLERLVKGDELLELILKGLNAYLEAKRLYFARFFFLSNDELLEILSETKDPTRVQAHLKKCFEGISKLTFTQDLDITHMVSSQKEKIELADVISTADARGQVEQWLLQLQQGMIKTIRIETLKSMDEYPTMPRIDWVKNWPGQVVLSVSQKFWTQKNTLEHQRRPESPRRLQG